MALNLKKVTQIFVSSVFVISSSVSSAAEPQSEEDAMKNQTVSKEAGGANSQGTAAIKNVVEATYKAPSVQNQANATTSNMNLGQIAAIGASGYMLYTALPMQQAAKDTKMASCAAKSFGAGACAAAVATTYGPILAGIVLLAGQFRKQGQAFGQTGIESEHTASQLSVNSATDGTHGSKVQSVGGSGNNDATTVQLNGVIKPLEDEGYVFSSNGNSVTTPDGKKITIADLKNVASMKKAGISAGAAGTLSGLAQAAVNVALEEAKKKVAAAQKKSDGADDSSGGGGSGFATGSGSGSNSDSSYGIGGSASMGLKNDLAGVREPTSMAGMSKTYNGEQIGVSADSIFHMMNRRYNTKKEQDSFYSDAELFSSGK